MRNLQIWLQAESWGPKF